MSSAASVSLLGALLRGFACRCPACGEGKAFRAYLKVADHCPACGEELSHHRADDLPAYLIVLIMSHPIVAIALYIDHAFTIPMWVQFVVEVPLCALLVVGILQPVKGAVVAFQWQMGMHGFDHAKQLRQQAEATGE